MLPFGRSMAAKCRWKNQRWMAYSGDASASSSNERTRSELLTPAVRKRSSMVFIALLVVADTVSYTHLDVYKRQAFERFGADAVTLNPYMGKDSAQPFLDYNDRGCVFLCHTSNPGARDFQELLIEGAPLYQHIARTIANDWNADGNCALVVGATFPEELKVIRNLVGDMPLLIPGIGAQGGDVEAVVKNGKTADGSGLMINSSRGILYAAQGDGYAEAAADAARELRDTINRFR